jgi:hypothetical protein
MRIVLIILMLKIGFYAAGSFASNECLLCKANPVPEGLITGPDEICNDLYGAACLDVKNESKYKNRGREMLAKWNIPIADARDKTAKAMGFKNFDESL